MAEASSTQLKLLAESNSAPVSIPLFDGYYDHWSELMENFIRSRKLWHLIETGVPTPVQVREQVATFSTVVAEGRQQTEAQRKREEDLRQRVEQMKEDDLKVKNFLFQAIHRTIMDTILDRSSSKSIWDSMKQKYHGSSKVKRASRQALKKDFEILQMKEDERIDEFFARTLTIVNKLKVHGGQNMSQVDIVEKILRSLTPRFDYVACSIEESNDLDTMTVDELHSSLLVHEQRLCRINGGMRDDQALKVTSSEGGNRGRGNRGRGRGGNMGRGRGRGIFNKAMVECYKCHKLGHFQYECPTWNKEINYAEAEFNEHEEILLMAYVDLNEGKREDVWFLDSGCSNHMSGDLSKFCDLDERVRHHVKLGNNYKMMVQGRGRVKIAIHGVTYSFSDVFYVPGLTNNLLSIGQLQERGLAVLMHEGKCRVYHPERGLIIQTTMTTNRMFVIVANTQEEKCFHSSVQKQDLANLWHCRFAHLSHKGLKLLQEKEMVSGLPKLTSSSSVCVSCLVGKQHRDPIPKKSTWRATHKLQLVHADLCGPITPESNSKKRYVLCFIDDFSRKAWTVFLVEKSETFSYFKSLV